MEIHVPAGDLGELLKKPEHTIARARYPITMAPDCGCNTQTEQIIAHINANIRLGLPQCTPMPLNNLYRALIVCGGPSLEETKDELIEQYWAGHRIIAVNGAYEWCLRNNLRPGAAVMIDAREFNARFIERPVPECKYLLASQCHPKAFEYCRGRETYIWHAIGSGSEQELEVLRKFYFYKFHPVTLGTTIGIRTISLMRMLGFKQQDIFGLDSCWLDDKHHSYSQPENDGDGRLVVTLRPRTGETFHDDHAQVFHCAPWHVKQAEDFQFLLRERGEMFILNVRGRGLLATMMRTGATLQAEEDARNTNSEKESAA